MDRKRFDAKRVGRAVRFHRDAAGLTQADLAERANLAFETISRVESGREPPSLNTAVSLADAMAVSVDAVLGRGPAPKRNSGLAPELRRLLVAASRVDRAVLGHLIALCRALRKETRG